MTRMVKKKTSIASKEDIDPIKPLQLKIPESKKNEFKAFSAMQGQSMNVVFLEMFEFYKSQKR